MATTKKLKDSVFKKVIITNRNPEEESMSGFVGSNMVVINGTPQIKHYIFKLGEPVELPEICIEQLKNLSYIGRDKDGTPKKIPVYIVEEAA